MRPYILYALAALTLRVAACAPEEKKEQPLTKADALKFSRRLDSAIAGKDATPLNGLIHTETFWDHIVALTQQESTPRLITYINNLLDEYDFGGQLISYTDQSGCKFDLLHQYEKDNSQHLVYRLSGGKYYDHLNYFDLQLVKVGDQLHVADIFNYLTGENLSRSFTSYLLNVQWGQEFDNVEGSNYYAWFELSHRMAESNHEEAKYLFDGLPAVIKGQKTTQVQYLDICSGLDEETFARALNEFEVRFRQERNLHLVWIDLYRVRMEYDKALDEVNKLDIEVNNDPYLDLLRNSIYKAMGKPELAVAVDSSALTNKPVSYPEFKEK